LAGIFGQLQIGGVLLEGDGAIVVERERSIAKPRAPAASMATAMSVTITL
jgi:hypothetical protein